MSQDHVLFSLLKATFALLFDNETNVGENCDDLLENLDDRIKLLRRSRISDDLHTSLTHLRNAVASLDSCFQNLKDKEESPTSISASSNEQSKTEESDLQRVSKTSKEVASFKTDSPDQGGTKQPTNSQNSMKYRERQNTLQKEILEIEASKDFKEAMDCFLESKKVSAIVFENENGRETKITATKVRVISEIFVNLTDNACAARNCLDYILELNGIFNLQGIKSPFPFWHKALKFVNMQSYFESPERVGLDSAMRIHIVVFRFIKEFSTKPIIMLNWPMINTAREETYHPILGEQLSKTNAPDPFTAINHDEQWIDPQALAVNCSGEIFAKGVPVKDEKISAPIGIMRISDHTRYDVDKMRKIKILSVSVDCDSCVTMPSTTSEATAQSSEATTSHSQPNTQCNGKMYILASTKERKYFLCIIDMEGTIQHKEEQELKPLYKKRLQQARIFSIRKNKILILDVSDDRIDIYIFDEKGKYFKTIDLIPLLPVGGISYTKPTIFTISYNGEIICSEGRNKLAIYNIEEDCGSLRKAEELIEVKYVVQAVAFNHESDELVILCYTSVFFEYHLAIYTKAGKLKQDIKLQNSSYRDAKLIFNRNGRVVLLDASKYLHLK